jgi:N-acetylmuramoyl-L-alanine amidase
MANLHRYHRARRRLAEEEYARRRLRRQRVTAVFIPAVLLVGGAATAAVIARHGDSRPAGAATTVPPPSALADRGSAESLESPTTRGKGRIGGITQAGDDLLRGKTIAIDPGHNGGNFSHPREIGRLVDAGTLSKACDTTGTSTDSGYTEAAYNLDVARRLGRRLRKAGAKVVLTRTTNSGWGPCITERAAIGNRARADAAISIHADGGPPGGHGFHVIYPPAIQGLTDDIALASRRLALAVRQAFRRGTGMPFANYIGSQGLDARTDLGGLNLSDVPKVFIETGNMRNAEDAHRLRSPAFREREARALARGLEAFLNPASK